jgi:hypothetical protein
VDAPPAGLTSADRRAICDTFETVLGGVYTHLPLKRARYGIDPVQRVRLLRDRAADVSDDDFHAEMSEIVTGLRDAHTRYVNSVGGRSGQVAVLPFLAEFFGPPSQPSYVVSKTGPQQIIKDPEFVPGVQLLSWNGIAFDRAVSRYADNETGGRGDARRARAVLSLTFRSLEYGPPPDEDWVVIGYRTATGADREVRLLWRVISPQQAPSAADPTEMQRAALLAQALDPAAEAVRRARQLMFAPEVWQATTAGRSPKVAKDEAAAPGALPPGSIPSKLPDVLNARKVTTAGGDFGYLRIFSFSVNDDEAFVREVARLVALLPQRGLIIDIRNNPGGLVWAAERILQLFTPRRVEPCRFSWLATDVTRALAGNAFGAASTRPWTASLAAAVSTGEAYSQALPLTDPEACNDLGQRYGGPVLCVADANTYSSGDIFSAGFVDNRLGDFVTVGDATGAGGANVWRGGDVRQALAGTRFALDGLPDGVSFTMAVRRVTRVGEAAGTPVEDLGVPGATRYDMTLDDLVSDNKDLIAWACTRLAQVPSTSLDASVARGFVTVTTAGLDVVDLYANGHPWESVTTLDRAVRRRVPEGTTSIEVIGWAAGTMAQRRLLAV